MLCIKYSFCLDISGFKGMHRISSKKYENSGQNGTKKRRNANGGESMGTKRVLQKAKKKYPLFAVLYIWNHDGLPSQIVNDQRPTWFWGSGEGDSPSAFFKGRGSRGKP